MENVYQILSRAESREREKRRTKINIEEQKSDLREEFVELLCVSSVQFETFSIEVAGHVHAEVGSTRVVLPDGVGDRFPVSDRQPVAAFLHQRHGFLPDVVVEDLVHFDPDRDEEGLEELRVLELQSHPLNVFGGNPLADGRVGRFHLYPQASVLKKKDRKKRKR